MMIASVGPCLPMDLLMATGRYAGPLPWRLDRPMPAADLWLESKFPGWSCSLLQDWADGAFDDRQAVVFSRGDDAAQRLYYYICELQRRGRIAGPRALIADIAQIPRATSVAHTIAAVRRLAAAFELDPRALEGGIAAANARRSLAGEGARPGDRPACLIAGTPPPHGLLHAAVRAAGWQPVGPTQADEWTELGPPVEEGSGDPAAAIGRQVHARRNDRRGFRDQAAETVGRGREAGAAAAVLWYTEEDEARVWELPCIREALAAAGVPALVLTRRDEAGRDGALDAIGAFLKELR